MRIILAMLMLVGCAHRPPGPQTAALRNAITLAQENTAGAISDGKEVRRLAGRSGERFRAVDGRLRRIDFKATRLLELLEK